MSKLNINRKLFLEQEELIKFQEFIADSPSENAIIGNTNSWGILRTDFQSDSDFKVELGSNAGTIKIAKAVNKALTSEGNRILQEAIDNIQITNDDSWYWVRISHEFNNQEPGTVNINVNGEVSGGGTEFISVLRGQATKVPTKVRFVKQDGTTANNSSFYEVVDVIDNLNCILSSSVDFVAESDLKLVVLGSTPIGEAITTSQEEGLYKYDSCNLELVPEVVSDTPPTSGYVEDLTFYFARVKNNAGVVTIEDKRTDYWEFNIIGLTDRLSIYNNLSDLRDVSEARDNLFVYSKTQSDQRFFILRGDLGTENINNLNDETFSGIYSQPINSRATTANNYPVEVSGVLEVFLAGGVIQRYTTDRVISDDSRIFVRSYDLLNGWGSWVELANYNKVYKKSEIGSIASKDFWQGTQSEYDNILAPDSNTIYFIL